MTDGYPSDWDTRREMVYSRDDHTCQNCGIQGGSVVLHAHHVVPISKGGSHDLSNLVTICNQCHSSIHNDGEMARTEAKQLDNIDPREYEGIERGIVKMHIITDGIQEHMENILTYQQRLHDYIEKMFEYVDEPETSVPNKLAKVYIGTYAKFEQNISQVRSSLVQIKDTKSQFNFSSTTEEAIQEYIEAISNLIEARERTLEEYDSIALIDGDSVILRVVSSESVEWDVNVQVAYDEIRDLQKEASKVNDEVSKQFEKEVN